MRRPNSITRQLVAMVLGLELLAAAALISAITIHERHVQLKAFDATLMGTAQSLMGAVQDAEDEGDNVMLDMRGVQLGRDAIYRVEDEHGRVLGSSGPILQSALSSEPGIRNFDVAHRAYRFVTLHGLRIIDPGKPNGGVRHDITIVYGIPVGHVWHEVFEAIRFFAIATVLLLGVTAAVMAWMIRRGLSPIHELAREADRINSNDWHFASPESAKTTAELVPLVTALEAALARLERSFQQQRRFTSDAAHELKTDMAIVKSSLQLLLMRKRTVDEYGQGIALSLDDFTRLERTVEKMLTLARLEQPAGGETSSCAFRDVIDEAVFNSTGLAELKSLTLRTESMADARVPIDRRDAMLLCSNLLSNAIRYSPHGSTVWISLAAAGPSVHLTIRDQGVGIAEEDKAHLFEPFYRGDPSRSRKSGGTGLGLSICKAICERVGGSIEIGNHVGGGAVVTVALPALSMPSEPAISASLMAQ
jgi:two-component system OmpR family sensor kinase